MGILRIQNPDPLLYRFKPLNWRVQGFLGCNKTPPTRLGKPSVDPAQTPNIKQLISVTCDLWMWNTLNLFVDLNGTWTNEPFTPWSFSKNSYSLVFFPEICLETNGFKPLGYLESKLTTKMGVLNPIDGANMWAYVSYSPKSLYYALLKEPSSPILKASTYPPLNLKVFLQPH